MAPARGLAELLLGTQGSPDVLAGWSVKDLSNSQPSFAATAAAVAAARLAAAAAADYVLVPSKADAVAAPGIGGAGKAHWGGGACPLGYGSKASLTGLKTYPHVTVPSTLGLLCPPKLMWLFLKNTGLVFLLQTNMWLYQALEAEEAALQQGTQAQLPPYPDVLAQLVKSCWNSWRELLTALTRSEIKHAISRRASARTAWKVLKDPRESLTRKALFYADTPSWQLLPLYVNTMFRTQLPMYAAELIVACVYDAVDELRRLLAGLPLPRQQQQHAAAAASLAAERLVGAECLLQPEGGQLRGLGLLQLQLQELISGRVQIAPAELSIASKRWLLRAAKNVLRVSSTAVCAAVGSGVAGAVAPRERAGVWAVRGHILSDLVFANLLMLALDGGFALAFGPGPEHKEQQEQQHHLSQYGLTS
uniref:Uncharacterized protein n=1 Tax=Tetradesmus obliquus TaxID=3088 RepID=A0A383VZ44_TETOB|eukprot:jgi/Sobl393_1/13131/SZX70491.1